MVKNIVFDFGGVLVSYDFNKFFTGVLGSKEKATWFLDNVLTDDFNNRLDHGLKSVNELLGELKAQFPAYVDAINAFDVHYTDIFTGEVPGIVDLMKELKGKGYHLYGLSNWSTKVFEVMKKFPRPFSLLEDCLISHQVKLLKPQPAIYRAFCKKMSVKPEDCIFIDDKKENILGAKSIGMDGITFTGTDALRKELAEKL
jgi:epoxide hydrolase-like predicted phosphatase